MVNKSQDAEIAVLQTQVGNIEDTVKRIETKIDIQTATYVTKEEFVAFKKQYWLSHTMTALLTAVITGLVFYFFKVKGG